MKEIILASYSLQRRKLLELVGVPFRVIPSRIKEAKTIRTSCADLVKDNALLKAKWVARLTKDSVVIGADTVVYVGHKTIIGKPKNWQEARRILKILFARPSWVYTGLAIIDVQAKRKIVDFEKTKVFMSALSDEEIETYHKKVHPFDKAGGFDIEGAGGLFIHRIEGCYSNVIGLPLPKLHQMLKKIGINILNMKR